MRRRYFLYMAFVLTVGLSFGIGSLVSALDASVDIKQLRRVQLADWSSFEEISRGSTGTLSISIGEGQKVRIESWYPAYDGVRDALRRQETPSTTLLVDDSGLVLGSEGEPALAITTTEVSKARRSDALATGAILVIASLIGAFWIFRRGREEQSSEIN